MAATVTLTTTAVTQLVTKYSLAWTSHTDGTVSGISKLIGSGTIIDVAFLPGSGGTQPTDAYDLTLLCDAHGGDMLVGEGANLSNATGKHVIPVGTNTAVTPVGRQWLHGGGYTLTIANAGSGKTGTVDLYVCSRPV